MYHVSVRIWSRISKKMQIRPDPVPQHCLNEIYFRYRRQCCGFPSLNFIINYMKLKTKLYFFTILLYYFPDLLLNIIRQDFPKTFLLFYYTIFLIYY
jgi:hypothetical protein